MLFPSLIFFLSVIKLSLTELAYNDDATCSVTNAYSDYILDESTVTYFRSPNFPLTMYYNSTTSMICNARFDTASSNSKIWFVIYNGNIGVFNVWNYDSDNKTMSQFDENSYFVFAPSSNTIMFNFMPNRYNVPWTAFEAVVYAYSSKNICPFSEEIIKLENDRIIPIASNYDLDSNFANMNCIWKFSMNPNQTFKIVFKFLNISDPDTSLQLETDGNIVAIFNTTVSPFHPIVYYGNSTIGNFTLSYNSSTNTSITTKFFALVSVVEKNPNITKQICPQNSTVISNMNYEHGYSAFDSCYSQFLIPQNIEILLNVRYLKVEKGVDKLILYKSAEEESFELDYLDYFYLTSDANGTILDFSADGNTQQAGFTVHQNILNCTCSKPDWVIPCTGAITITPLSTLNLTYYCHNMACNYTISLEKTCNTSHFLLDYYFSMDKNDSAIIFENGVMSDNFTTSSVISGLKIVSKESNIFLQFTSGPSPASIYSTPIFKQWQILAKPLNPNFYPTFQLTDAIPFFVLQSNNLNEDDVFVICAAVENDTLEMFISERSNTLWNEDTLLFDSDKMENFIGNLNSPLINTTNNLYPRHVSSKSGCFTIYNGIESVDMFLFFRMKNAHSKNCENTNNVFSIKKSGDTYFTFAANADDGPCEITLLAATEGKIPAILFTDLTASSSNSNDSYEISSAINQKIYFNFNLSDIYVDMETLIYSPALNIKIPQNQSLSVTANTPRPLQNIYLSEYEYHGFFASPEYGGYSIEKYHSSDILLYEILGSNKTYNIEFYVNYFNGSGTVVFTNGNKNITLEENYKYSLNGSTFKLIYHPSPQLEFLIEYTVTQIFTPPPPTTTPTSTLRPTTTTAPIQPTNVTLNSKNVYYVFWLDNLDFNQYITVCTESDDDLELFVTDGNYLYNYDLFDFNGFSNYVGTLSSSVISSPGANQPRSITSKSNCFTVIKTANSNSAFATLLFRRKIQQSQNCINNNIFEASSILRINVSSNGNKCETIFLASIAIIGIQSIKNGGTNDNYIFKSAINKMPLMNISSIDAINWRNIAIYTNALSITFSNTLEIQFYNNGSVINIGEQTNLHGILVSPSYCGFLTKIENPFLMYHLDNFAAATNSAAVEFFVKYLDYSNIDVVVSNLDEKNNHTFLQYEKYMTIGNHFDIFYKESITPNSGFLIEYTLTSISQHTVIDLTVSSPTYVFWLDNLQPLEMITVCSPNIDTLQLFVTQSVNNRALQQYLLFDSNQMDALIGNLNTSLFDPPNLNGPKQITSSTGCFTIYNQGNLDVTYTTMFFRMQNEQSKNCYNSKNVFEIQSNSMTVFLSATPNGSCDVILLSSNSENPVIPINSFDYVSSGSYLLRSGINQNPLITIDKNNANVFQNFKIFTPALSIQISSSSTLTIQLDSYNDKNYQINNITDGQKGIIASPAYNGFMKPYSRTSMFTFYPQTYRCNIKKCGVNFNVNSTDYGSVKYNDGSDHIFRENDDITTFGNSFTVDYAQGKTNSSFLITYTIVMRNSSVINIPAITTLIMCFLIAIFKNINLF